MGTLMLLNVLFEDSNYVMSFYLNTVIRFHYLYFNLTLQYSHQNLFSTWTVGFIIIAV